MKQLFLVSALGCASLSSFFLTETTAQGRPPEPPFAAIGADLGLSAGQVEACFPKPKRSSGGGRPERPDMSSVTTCLKKADGSLSDAEIRQVLEANAPEHGGRPQKG